MVIMLRQCCCCCSLKTGTIILGVLNIVSTNFSSTLLTVSNTQIKKLQFTRVAKLLALSIKITFEQCSAILAHCLKNVRQRKCECQKRKQLYIWTHQIRCKQDFGACDRLEVFVLCLSQNSK